MSKEFKFTSFWKWFHRIYGAFFTLALVFIIYRVIFAINSFGKQGLGLAPLLIFLCVLYATLGLFRGDFERIVLSPDGFQYHTLGYSVRTDWKNLKRIGNQKQGLFYEFEGVFANYFSEDLDVWLWLPSATFGKEKFVPLSMFSKNWCDSDLGQQIKQYVPHLFQ